MGGVVQLLILVNLTSNDPQISSLQQKTIITGSGCGISNPIHVPDNPVSIPEGRAEFGEFPWTVKIGDEYSYAGVLIHPQVVLTVSHNNRNQGKPVRAGKWNLDRDVPGYPSQQTTISSTVAYPNVDLALLFLKDPFKLEPHINTICLPKSLENMENVKNCYETSWGRDRTGFVGNLMKKMPRDTMRFDKCQDSIRSSSLGNSFVLNQAYLCAGNLEGLDGCIGDGGAPLSCPIPNGGGRYQLGGVDAWGPEAEEHNSHCTSKYLPLGFTSAPKYRDWIDEQMRLHNFDTSYYTPPA